MLYVSQTLLVEWLANNYKSFGATMELITNKSQEGAQFVRGFGGIGAILRWKVDFIEITSYEDVAAAGHVEDVVVHDEDVW